MEELPIHRRRLYLGGLIFLFVIVAPILALYASGYRLTDDFRLIKTGGIYVEIERAGASFFLDDAYEGSGSLFQKSFFIQNLVPGSYTVRIERDGFRSWRKDLEVYPTLITSGKALMLPQEPTLVEVPSRLPEASGRSSINPRYEETLEAFEVSGARALDLPAGATTTIQYRGATTTVYERGGIGLFLDEAGLHAWWVEEEDRFPYFFCRAEVCEREILVAGQRGDIGHFDFFPEENQFVLIEWPDGIFATELDTRRPQNIQPLYPRTGARFRIINGTVYIFDDNSLYEVAL